MRTQHRVLITGGAGFIGSHTAEELLRCGHGVTILDNFSTGSRKNIAAIAKKTKIIEGDMNHARTLEKALPGVTTILHLAAVSSVQQSFLRPDLTHEANVTGALNIFTAAADRGIKKIVYASSCAVYGNDPRLPKKEQMDLSPLSFYAETKRINEMYAQLFHMQNGIQAIGMRYFNVFGERQDPRSPYSGVISIFMKKFAAGERPVIFGDGEQTRDFIYVKDIAVANRLALESQSISCDVFNVGSGRALSLNRLTEVLGNLHGKSLKPVYKTARPGEVRHSVAHTGKIRQKLGFKPYFQTETALRQMLEFA